MREEVFHWLGQTLFWNSIQRLLIHQNPSCLIHELILIKVARLLTL